MALQVSCQTCSERLDDRDIKNNVVACWKCGWKTTISIMDDEEEDVEWIDQMLDIWLPYD